LAVDGVEVFDDVVRFVIRVGVLDDLRSARVFMRDRRDGVTSDRPNALHLPSFVRPRVGK